MTNYMPITASKSLFAPLEPELGTWEIPEKERNNEFSTSMTSLGLRVVLTTAMALRGWITWVHHRNSKPSSQKDHNQLSFMGVFFIIWPHFALNLRVLKKL